MPLQRKVPVRQALRYKGGANMLSWLLHRISGLGILAFVGMHVLAAFFLQQLGDDLAITLTTFYESWQFQIFIYFCILFHALHGTRLALMDLFPALLRYNKELLWLQWAIFVPLFGLPAFIMIQTVLQPA